MEQEGTPVAFQSSKLGPRGQFVPGYETELLVIIHAFPKIRQLIGTYKIREGTDHATPGRALQQKNVAPRLGYW